MVEPKGNEETEVIEDKKGNAPVAKVGPFDNLKQTNTSPAPRYVPKKKPVYVIQRKSVIAQKQYQVNFVYYFLQFKNFFMKDYFPTPATEPQNTSYNNNQRNKQDAVNGRSHHKSVRRANKQVGFYFLHIFCKLLYIVCITV